MNHTIRLRGALLCATLVTGFVTTLCGMALPQTMGRTSEEVRVAQAAVEKAREAARLATEQAGEAGQQTTESGDLVNENGDVYVAKDQTVEGDVIAVNGSARVHGKVKGSVTATGGSIFLANSSEVGGNVISFGGKITREPRATVAGLVREMPGAKVSDDEAEPVAEEAPPSDEPEADEAPVESKQPAAPAVRPRSQIVQFGRPVSVAADEVVNGDVVSMGGPVDIAGEVQGDVVSIGGPVRVQGKVRGDAVAVGGPLNLEDGAEVQGDAVAVGGPLSTASGADVKGQTVDVGGPMGNMPLALLGKLTGVAPVLALIGGAAAWLTRSLAILILVALTVLVLPRPTETIAASIRQEPGRALVHGLIGWLLVLPILVILIALVVTWILIPVYLLALVALLLVGYVGVVQLLGKEITAWRKWSIDSLLAVTLVGIVALAIVDLLACVPVVGFLTKIVTIVVMVFALGGALMTRFGTDPTGTWLAGRAGNSGGPVPAGDVTEPSAAASDLQAQGDPETPAPHEPDEPDHADLDEAAQQALREVEGGAEPEASGETAGSDEPLLDEFDERTRQALSELPPDGEPEGPSSDPSDAPQPDEPDS